MNMDLTPAEIEEALGLCKAASTEVEDGGEIHSEGWRCVRCSEQVETDPDLDVSPLCNACAQEAAERLAYFFPRVLGELESVNLKLHGAGIVDSDAPTLVDRVQLLITQRDEARQHGYPKPGTRCPRCHISAPNPNGCAQCNPFKLGDRLTSAILDANGQRSRVAELETLVARMDRERKALEARLDDEQDARAEAEGGGHG